MPEIVRLSWAGARVRAGDVTILIDPLFDGEPLAQLGMGTPRTPLVAPAESGTVDVIAVTHVHPDHCDASGWKRMLRSGGVVLGPAPVVAQAKAASVVARTVEPWESVTIGDVVITAVPAVDGFGEDQLSWIIGQESWSLFHGGDTLWHGHWWRIARKYGSPSVAMLPVNGAVTAFPGMRSSPLPAAMTPEQAVVASVLLGTQRLVPIHYGEFHAPPVYIETPDLQARLLAAATEHGVTVEQVVPGHEVAGTVMRDHT